LALADKLDTLRECFRVGLEPSGSKDPFALRRAAQGVVKILVEARIEITLESLTGGDPALFEFFLERMQYYFREILGFKYDEVNAVLSHYPGASTLADIESRLSALAAVRLTEDFEPLAASFKRIKNILRQASFAPSNGVDADLLDPGPERELYNDFKRVQSAAKGASYRTALETVASLRPRVDAFFDKVLVNAPDARIRANRLTLLYNLLTEFSTIADFSEIVTAGEQK
jgi:glycyl-tRNA synthetase beta chain